MPKELKTLLFNEKKHPQLFGCFVSGAKAAILSNKSGNVSLGACNGTRCEMDSIMWKDKDASRAMNRL